MGSTPIRSSESLEVHSRTQELSLVTNIQNRYVHTDVVVLVPVFCQFLLMRKIDSTRD
ncbi:hypothetical protein LCGC14_2108130 [marine sediment metagenome]|uniref:Uncharacterized protein n=1 Tax=marine sediment metagenome TaxID=412755 RepID=A0A0F9H460_9ZZZZ